MVLTPILCWLLIYCVDSSFTVIYSCYTALTLPILCLLFLYWFDSFWYVLTPPICCWLLYYVDSSYIVLTFYILSWYLLDSAERSGTISQHLVCRGFFSVIICRTFLYMFELLLVDLAEVVNKKQKTKFCFSFYSVYCSFWSNSKQCSGKVILEIDIMIYIFKSNHRCSCSAM